MKPDKFDILKEVIASRLQIQLKNRGDNGVPKVFLNDLLFFLSVSDDIYSNYDEPITLEQNIEKHLS